MRFGLIKRADDTGKEYAPFHWDIDKVFEDFFSLEPLFNEGWNPRIDVSENDTALYVTAEVPGLSEKEINVTMEKSVLTISGEKKEERDEKDEKKNIMLSERRYGSFSRSLRIPDGVKVDGIKAEFKNGLLTIELPKDESAQPKKIEVNVH